MESHSGMIAMAFLYFEIPVSLSRCWCCHQQLCSKPARFSVTCQVVVGDNTNNGL